MDQKGEYFMIGKQCFQRKDAKKLESLLNEERMEDLEENKLIVKNLQPKSDHSGYRNSSCIIQEGKV